MQAGKLRHRLRVERNTSAAQDVYGEKPPSWVPLTTRYGSVEPLSGRELYYAKQVNSDITHKVTMRYYAGLRTADRLVYQGRALNILSIVCADERREMVEIMCQEQV